MDQKAQKDEWIRVPNRISVDKGPVFTLQRGMHFSWLLAPTPALREHDMEGFDPNDWEYDFGYCRRTGKYHKFWALKRFWRLNYRVERGMASEYERRQCSALGWGVMLSDWPVRDTPEKFMGIELHAFIPLDKIRSTLRPPVYSRKLSDEMFWWNMAFELELHRKRRRDILRPMGLNPTPEEMYAVYGQFCGLTMDLT